MVIDHILTAAGDITHRTMLRPDEVRCHPETALRIDQEMWARALTPHPYTIPGITENRGAVGMRVEVDPWLPPGMFRLCDEDGTLLYDSREGTSAL